MKGVRWSEKNGEWTIFTKALSLPKYNDFKVRTEDDENFFKFDDVIFTHGSKTILFQAKLDEKKTIDLKQISTTYGKLPSFALSKYYNTFLKMKLIKNNADTIEHLILFTNLELNKDALHLFKELNFNFDFLNIPIVSRNIENVLETFKTMRIDKKVPICY